MEIILKVLVTLLLIFVLGILLRLAFLTLGLAAVEPSFPKQPSLQASGENISGGYPHNVQEVQKHD